MAHSEIAEAGLGTRIIMATVDLPPDLDRHQPPTERLREPLGRLRRSIRLYVLAEGLGLIVLYLALWFWFGLLLDYGVFRVFTIDWVQELPHGLRAGILCTLVGVL